MVNNVGLMIGAWLIENRNHWVGGHRKGPRVAWKQQGKTIVEVCD